MDDVAQGEDDEGEAKSGEQNRQWLFPGRDLGRWPTGRELHTSSANIRS